MYANVRELPNIVQEQLNGVGYGRADILIEAREKVSPQVSGGDGQRGFCIIIDMISGNVKHMMGSWGGANMFNPRNQVDLDSQMYEIPENVAVITGSIGGSVFATVTLNPKNVAKFLPAKSELTKEQASVLYSFKALKSAYRPKYSEECLNELAEMGFLKRSKNGATRITTAGKNAYLSSPYKFY